MRLLSVLAITFMVASCSTYSGESGKTVLLLHGAHLDGTSWKAVKDTLESKGFKVVAPNLPGRSDNKNVDLNDYARYSCDQVGDQTVVVAHSQGGAVVNQMVGKCSDKIKKIIYISAVVPLNGERAFDLMGEKDGKNYRKVVVFKKDRAEPKNKRGFIRAMAQDFDLKTMKAPTIFSEPTKLATTVVDFKSEEYDSIPKAYILTTNDLVVSLETQKKYTERIEFQEIYEIDSGHLPMVTKASELADLITRSSNL